MSEPANDPIAELREQFGALQRELRELKEAPVGEKQDARDDVAEAEADVIDAARRAGVKPEVYKRAIAEAKRAQFREEHGDEIRAMVSEEMERMLAEAEKAEAEKETELEVESASEKPKREPKAKVEKVEEDTAPEHPHWSERAIGEMIR